MNALQFDTLVHQAAMRNGWDVCEKDEGGIGRLLRSTAHPGLLHVFPEGELFLIISANEPERLVVPDALGAVLSALADKEIAAKENAIPQTEQEHIVKVRSAQYLYRAALEQLWDSKCACTGIDIPELLRASHAKPWKDCSDSERVDPYNGFLLEARYDLLFDKGLITFSDEGDIILSPRLNPEVVRLLQIPTPLRIKNISPLHHPYLHWHRQHVFQS